MKHPIAILMLTALAGAAVAESPEIDAAYFHPAASLYIHGDTVAASNLVARGLSLYPDDGKLKRLKELLEKQQQQNENQQNQDQQQQQDQQAQNQDQQQPQEQQAKPMEISKEDAERMLSAIQQQEKDVKEKVDKQKAVASKGKTEKDW